MEAPGSFNISWCILALLQTSCSNVAPCAIPMPSLPLLDLLAMAKIRQTSWHTSLLKIMERFLQHQSVPDVFFDKQYIENFLEVPTTHHNTNVWGGAVLCAESISKLIVLNHLYYNRLWVTTNIHQPSFPAQKIRFFRIWPQQWPNISCIGDLWNKGIGRWFY